MEDVLAQKKVLTMKEKELAELEASFQTPFRNKKPLCSNCHTSGHNRVMCSFAPCVSATICKDIKKHQDEEKYYKSLQMQIKSEKSKLKRLEDDKNSKQESYQASINTFAGEVQTDLINSNPSKYLRSTSHGTSIPNWLLAQTDIRKLEKICGGKVPQKGDIPDLLKQYDEELEGATNRQDVSKHVSPVKRLWEQTGLLLPGEECFQIQVGHFSLNNQSH